MALFSSKKNKEEKKAAETASTAGTSTPLATDLAHVLRHARITEKATMHSAQSIYVFDVAENASKRDIMAAIRKVYQVTPHKVRVARIPSKTKRSMRNGKTGTKKGGKKAYIYLKKGETINI